MKTEKPEKSIASRVKDIRQKEALLRDRNIKNILMEVIVEMTTLASWQTREVGVKPVSEMLNKLQKIDEKLK